MAEKWKEDLEAKGIRIPPPIPNVLREGEIFRVFVPTEEQVKRQRELGRTAGRIFTTKILDGEQKDGTVE